MTKRQSRTAETTTAIVYCRVSAQESQAATEESASLENQERTLTAAALAAGYTDVRVIIERHTASKRQPALEAALADLGKGQAGALYALKIDRLSRKGAGDVLRIADLADGQGWRLVIADVSLDTGSTVGRLVLTILAAVAEMESRRKSERMCEYHAGRRARGQKSGRDYGRRTTASADAVTEIRTRRSAGQSWQAITDALNAMGADGRTWHPTAVRRTYAAPAAA